MSGSRTDPWERDPSDQPDGTGAGSDEEARLNEALFQADRRLVASLKDDEARRRRRRWWLIGGIAMSLAITGILIGVLTTMGEVGATSRQDVRRAETITQQGWKLWQAQKWSEAESKFARAVELDPQAVNAWNGLGWSRFNGGHPTEAQQAFERCVKIEPAHAAAHNGLGWVHFNRHDFAKAEKHWTKAAANPGASAAWYGLAKLYLLQGDFAKAGKWTKKILSQQKDDPLAKRMLAAVRTETLTDDLRREIEPPKKGSAADHDRQGWIYFQRGMPTKAIAEFLKAIQLDPKEANAHNGLGFCLLNSGKVKEAKPYFEKCLKLQPNHWGAINGLARCYKAEGKVDQAVELWQRMVKECPGPNAGTSGLAWTYLETGKPAKAVPLFEELVKANPQDQRSKEGLAQAKAAAKK